MNIIAPLPTTDTEKAVHLIANFTVGAAMAVGFTLSSSPWGTGAAIVLSAIPLRWAGMEQASTYGLGLGLLGRAVRNILPLVKLAQRGAPLPEAMGIYLDPALQVAFGAGLTGRAISNENILCFHQDRLTPEQKDRIRRGCRII